MEKEEKRNKIWAFIILGIFILTSMLYYSVNVYYIYLVVYIWFGFAYGMMLQYGRFCFASASRDLFAAGVPRMAVGIMVDRKSTRLNSSHIPLSRMPSSA